MECKQLITITIKMLLFNNSLPKKAIKERLENVEKYYKAFYKIPDTNNEKTFKKAFLNFYKQVDPTYNATKLYDGFFKEGKFISGSIAESFPCLYIKTT